MSHEPPQPPPQEQQQPQQPQHEHWLVIITGASQGFGRAVAESFAAWVTRAPEQQQQRTRPIHVTLGLVARRHAHGLAASSAVGGRHDPAKQQEQEQQQHQQQQDEHEQQQDEQQDEHEQHVDDDDNDSNIRIVTIAADLSDLEGLDQVWDTVLNAIRRRNRSSPANQACHNDNNENNNYYDYDRAIFINNAGSIGRVGPCSGGNEPEHVGSSTSSSSRRLAEMRSNIDFNITSCLWSSLRFARWVQHELVAQPTTQNNNKEETAPFATAATTIPPTTPLATIVNVTSLAALTPFASMGLYSAGKAARDAYHMVLAQEWAAASSSSSSTTPPLRILSYAPGPLDTDMVRQARASPWLDPVLERNYQACLLPPRQSADVLVRLVVENDYVSGAHVDYFDVVRNNTHSNNDTSKNTNNDDDDDKHNDDDDNHSNNDDDDKRQRRDGSQQS